MSTETNDVDLLLIDDNQADVKLILHALAEETALHRIQVVRDGEAALDFLMGRGSYAMRSESPSPVLILLDLKIPKVSGLEVLKEIKSNPRTRVIPVVVLTSSKQDRDVQQSYELGANSYIQKPVDFESFRKALRQLVDYWLTANQAPLSIRKRLPGR